VDDTDGVETVNVALVWPAGTTTLGGTVAGNHAPSCTVAPPLGAAALSVTVPVVEDPPVTVLGLTTSPVTQWFLVDDVGLTVTFALADEGPKLAVIVAFVRVSTALAVHENRPVVLPDDTVTFGGTLRAGLLAARFTTTCPAGAGAASVTCPTPPWPPLTELTLRVSDETVADDPLIVSVRVKATSSYLAVTLTVVVVATLGTRMLNVPLVCPTGTTASGERPRAVPLLLIVTSASPVAGKGDTGIGALNPTVPVTVAPPFTLLALSVNDVSLGPGGFSASRRDAF
jgi:hypothetical protein